MKNRQSLSFFDGPPPSGELFYQKLSDKLIEERNKRRSKLIYGVSLLICVLLIAVLVLG